MIISNTVERERAFFSDKTGQIFFLSSIFFSLSLSVAYWHCMQLQMQLFVMTKMEQTKEYINALSLGRDKQRNQIIC